MRGRRFLSLCASALLLALCMPEANLACTEGARVEGVVRDQSGAAVTDAEISLVVGPFAESRTTNAEGRFVFDSVPRGGAKLQARARGFALFEKRWTISDEGPLEIVLAPEGVFEQVTVTAARTVARVSDTAASVIVLAPEDLSTTAALTLDDALRQVPGFSLFRRSGSRTANPTAQGVSLRGVGASGASRALVMADGIPINDPFGGWVYWGRVPRESVSRVEVVRGGSSHLYGTDALGGVVNFIPHGNDTPMASIEASYGNQTTPNVSMFAGGRLGKLGGQISAEAFSTDGYIIVDEAERGRVDTRATSDHLTLDVSVERLIADRARLFARGSYYGETRENGTPLQQNRTHIRQMALGADWQSRSAGSLTARLFASAQIFDQDFSAIALDRATETLTRSQRVPAQQTGLALQWSRPAGANQTLVAGLDWREVRGASDELVFVAGRLTSTVGAGGRERVFGLFGQDIVRITRRLFLTASARVDRWRNFDAISTSTPLALPSPPTVREFEERSETAFSPRLSLLHKLTENVSLTASGYRAFRAPTLNELYRAFRVGNVLTLANDALQAERLTGGEAGAAVAGLNRRINVRGLFFWSEIARPIANVTLSVTPELITRQRQNLGRTRSRGVELEAEAAVTDTFTVSGGYLLADATVLEFPANTLLEGLWLPQVPRHQLTFQARYSNPRRVTVGLQGRAIGVQFDDDQNRLKLDRYFTLDAFVSRAVGRGVELFAAAENLFDQEYDIGRTPVRTVGPPLLARFGVRLRFGNR
ncbi:MAG TPA: TonB-dependent receptor [Blastocatellia bacterium]|nr:TonB-dependent receptor [Blastocatellia bacterium]